MAGVLERALAVMEYLSSRPEGVPLASLAQQLEIPQSAAHRLRITCYDLGIRADTLVATVVYAAALAGTGASVIYLSRI